MADTGQLIVDTGATSSTGSTWSNITRIQTDNNQYATSSVSDGGTSRFVDATFTGTSIVPAGSTIDGVKVYIHAKGQGFGDLAFNSARIIIGGSRSGTSATVSPNSLGSSEATHTAGGATDLWGTGGITVAQVNAGSDNFGVSFNIANNGDESWIASVDVVYIEIFYTEAVAGGSDLIWPIT